MPRPDHFDRGYRGQLVSMRVSLGARGIVRRAASFEMFDATCCRRLALNSIADSENDSRVCSIDMPPLGVRPSPSLVTERLSMASRKNWGLLCTQVATCRHC